tara:strand:- start:7363 stop:8229 length:867 start_codon:yes stop_codon:yes gene_type:complete
MTKRKALGSGLEALLSDKPKINVVQSDTASKSSKKIVQKIPIDKISRNTSQPRKLFFDDSLQSMADTIKEHGQFTPILVREVSTGYELIAGERRWRAMQSLKRDYIDAIIMEASNKDSALIAIVENVQREQLNAIEEAEAFLKLTTVHSMTHEEISKYTGKSRSHVSNILRLNDLSDYVRTKLLNGEIDMGHARAVLSLDPSVQVSTIKQAIHKKLSVRALEEMVRKYGQNSLKTQDNKKPQDTIILEKELSEKLCADVNIRHNKGKGKIEIKYQSLEQLQGIIKKIK